MRHQFILVIVIGGIVLNSLIYGQAEVGQPAPPFQLENLSGDTVSTERLKGQIVLLTFFATWCAPCVVEMPVIEEQVWQVYKNAGVKVVGVNMNESPFFVEAFVNSIAVSYDIVIEDGSLFSQYGFRLPHNTLIAPDGTIALSSPGLELDKIVALIDQMLPITDVNDSKHAVPAAFAIKVYPNPVSRQQTLSLQIDTPGDIAGTVQIVNILGQQVQQFDIRKPSAGTLTISWDVRDAQDNILPKGIYFVRFLTSVHQSTKRFILLD